MKKLIIMLCLIAGMAKAQTPDKYVCLGDSFTLIVADSLSHTWYKGGVIAGTAAAYTETTTTPGLYNYTVISSTNGGCTSAASDAYTVSVLPTLTASISSPLTTVCATPGNSVILTCSAPNGTALQWYRNGVIITGASSSTYPVTESIAGNVTYSCQVAYSVLPGCFIQPQKVITVINEPVTPVIQ